MNWICLNGDFFPATDPIITIDNPSYKWGAGLFETIKAINGRAYFINLHFDRLASGCSILGIKPPFTDSSALEKIIDATCAKNGLTALSRIRVSVFRSAQDLTGYAIEAIALDAVANLWNDQGLKLSIFPDAVKAADKFSSLKSASYLQYRMATLYAETNGFDEALVFNSNHRLADASKANVFLVSNGRVITPSLSEAPVNGVVRKHLLNEFRRLNRTIEEGQISISDLLEADEIFLTNAIHGIRWVETFAARTYTSNQSREIYDSTLATIYR